jgi:hypothetical protein
MSFALPSILIGTSRLSAPLRSGVGERPDFGDFLDELADQRRGVLLTEGASWVWDILSRANRRREWDVCALVPNVAGYVREATDYGMFGAGWRRIRRMSPLSWLRLFFQGLRNVRGVLRKDFPTLLTLLLELEMANFRKVRPPVVFLHPQITDLLLAMDHGAALEKALKRIRNGFGAEPGLATYNLGTLLPRLQHWGIEVPYLLTAIHPRGYGMRPGQPACEEALRSFPGQIIATLETEFDGGIAAYWQACGVKSAVYDVAEPSVQEWRAWESWSDIPKPRLAVIPSEESGLVAAEVS